MPPKLHFIWAPGVPAELRKIERDMAMRILLALTRYAETGEGDIKALEGGFKGTYRLRVGDWRVRFRRLQGGAIYVIAVRNRGDAY
jgi:mRNA interferase RelE/StbE